MLGARKANPPPASEQGHMLRRVVLAWLVVSACAARAEDATDSASAATQQLRVRAGALLLSDYIYRGISSRNAS
jgi:hypothetical protein